MSLFLPQNVFPTRKIIFGKTVFTVWKTFELARPEKMISENT